MSTEPVHLIPDWRGDETLYSWSARMHRLLGGPTKETGRRLFGASHAYKEWVVHNSLEHLELVTGGVLGSTRSILLGKTALAAYYPFLRPAQREDFDARAAGTDQTSWLTRFGMRASGLDGVELRTCRHCVEADLRQWGAARWRLLHQMPGAWWCVEHDEPLNRMMPSTAEWVLPSLDAQRPAVLLDAKGARSLMALASLANSLIGKEQVCLVSIKRAVLSRLRDLGVVPSMKPVSAEDLHGWFARTSMAKAIRSVPDTSLAVFDRPWIYETLLKRRANHPLLWMVIWVSAFEEESLDELLRGFHEPGFASTWQQDGQGMLWSEDTFQADDRVRSIICAAPTLQEAARKLNVSVFTIRRYLKQAQCSPQDFRETEYRRMRKIEAEAEISNLIALNPSISATEIHSHCKAAVSWLRRWEPASLRALLNRVPKLKGQQMLLSFN